MPSGIAAPNCRKAAAATACACSAKYAAVAASGAKGEGKCSPPAIAVPTARLAMKRAANTLPTATREGPRCSVVSMNHSYHERFGCATASAMDGKQKKKKAGHPSAAWLLAQVGAHAAAQFALRLSALGLEHPHAGILRVVSSSGGISQPAPANRLHIFPSP